jgi:hypothetical protein
MRPVTVHGVDIQIRAVRLGGEAVIIDVDPRPLDPDGGGVHGVHEVGVLGYDAPVVRQGGDHHVAVVDVLRAHNEVVPAGGVLEVDARDFEVGGVLGVEEDWAVVFVVWVEDGACPVFELVPPALPVRFVSCGSIRQKEREWYG